MTLRKVVWVLFVAGVAAFGIRYAGNAAPAVHETVVNAQAPPRPPQLSCVARWSQPGEAGATCAAGEILSGGGCTCPGGTLRSSYPSPEGGSGAPGTAWQCDGQCPGGLKAVAMCCSVR